MKIFKSFSIVATLTLFSNFLGYFREVSFAAQYGATADTDAYFAAFFIPNTLYLILLAGSISTVFVPIFIDHLHQNKEEAWLIASSIFNVSMLLLIGVIVLFMATTRHWINLLFPGFNDQTMQMAVALSMILLPMLLFIGLATLVSAILHSLQHFTAPAVAPIISNIFIIVIIFYSYRLGGIYGVAMGVTVGMFLQFFLQLPILFRLGAKYHLTLNLKHPALKKVGKLSIPLMLYLLLSYLSLVIERNIASTLPEGTITSLNYALRIFSIPIAFTAGAIGTVIYPQLSLNVAVHNRDLFSQNIFRSITATLFFLTPISLGLIANSILAVDLLFGYGRFTANDVQFTAFILVGYAIGMVPTGMSRILQRASYALQDTVSPLLAEVVSLIIYALSAPILARYWGVWGLGLARGISFILVMIALFLLLARRPEILFSIKEVVLVISKYFFASIFAVTIFNLAWLNLFTTFDSRIESFVKIALFSFLAGIGYLFIGYVLRFGEIDFLRKNFPAF